MKIFAIMTAALLLPVATGAVAAGRTDEAAERRATAACVVEQQPGSVRDLLHTLPGSSAETAAAGKLGAMYTACSEEKFGLPIGRSSQGLYNGRAQIAISAARVALDSGADLSGAATATPWYMRWVAGRSPGQGYDPVSLGFQEFGSCVVKAAPQAAAQLVQSDMDSAEERQARAAIAPVLSGCIVPGKPMHIKLDQLRLMVAEPLYHLIVDGPAAGRRS